MDSGKHRQRKREREIAPRERSNPKPRALRLRHSTSSLTSNRTQIAPFNFAGEPRALRLRTLQLHRSTSTSNRTQIAPFDFASEPKAQITHSTSSRSHPRITLRWHRSHWDRNWEIVGFWWIWPDLMYFFWLGFVSVFIYWKMVLYICLEAEKMWENVRNKKKMCFLYSATQPNTRK